MKKKCLNAIVIGLAVGLFLTGCGDRSVSKQEVDEPETAVQDCVEESEKESVNQQTDSWSPDYCLKESNTRYYKEEEVSYLYYSKELLQKSINEIYARHGRIFKDPYWKDYFDSLEWYEGTIEPEAFDESVFNQYEKYNLELLKKVRNKEVDSLKRDRIIDFETVLAFLCYHSFGEEGTVVQDMENLKDEDKLWFLTYWEVATGDYEWVNPEGRITEQIGDELLTNTLGSTIANKSTETDMMYFDNGYYYMRHCEGDFGGTPSAIIESMRMLPDGSFWINGICGIEDSGSENDFEYFHKFEAVAVKGNEMYGGYRLISIVHKHNEPAEENRIPKEVSVNTLDELVKLSIDYRERHDLFIPEYVDRFVEEDGRIAIQFYEVVIDDPETGEGHTATCDWYYIDPETLRGEDLLGDSIDLMN